MRRFYIAFCVCVLLSFVATSMVYADNTLDKNVTVSDYEKVVSDFSYSPLGRRDPFKPLINKKTKVTEIPKPKRPAKIKGPLEKFELGQFRLMAIISVKGAPRAMVKAPDGSSYTVKIDDYIGLNDGKVKRIETKKVEMNANGMRVESNPDRIVVEESGYDASTGKNIKENRYIVM